MQWPLFVEETLFDTVLYRESVGLNSVERIPGRVSILRFRHLLETHHLPEQILATVNAALTNKGLMKLEFGPSAIIPEAGVYHDLGGVQGRLNRAQEPVASDSFLGEGTLAPSTSIDH